MKQDPDFLDPRDPDSVQNPTGPNYGNWNGNKRGSRTGSPIPPITPTPSQTPSTTRSYPHSVPTLGSGLFVLEILFVETQNPDYYDLDQTGWYYMQAKIGGISQDLCSAPFNKVMYTPGQNGIPALPPDLDFHGQQIFAGYGNCQYHAGNTGTPQPGFVTCTSAGLFYCDLESGTTSALDCGSGESRRPTIRCKFPTL